MFSTEDLVSNIAEVLVGAAQPGRIVLFGSQARGDATAYSDFDLMVVEDQPVDRFREMIRLRRLLDHFDVAIDLLVVSEERYQYWRDIPGNLYHEAASYGRTLYEAGVTVIRQ